MAGECLPGGVAVHLRQIQLGDLLRQKLHIGLLGVLVDEVGILAHQLTLRAAFAQRCEVLLVVFQLIFHNDDLGAMCFQSGLQVFVTL